MATRVLEESGLKRKYEFKVPAPELLQSVESMLEEEGKTLKMPGFREGKVPKEIVRKKIGAEVLSKVIEKTVDAKLKEYFESNKIRPAMQPYVEVVAFDDKTHLTFTVEFETFPKVPQINWDALENKQIELLKIEITEDDLKRAYEDIKKNYKNFEPAESDYVAKRGDSVLIDCVGTVDGNEFEGGRGQGIRLELGSNQFVLGFEDQLIGSKAGDEKQVNVTFPADYTNKPLANKAAVFEVKVLEVLKPEAVDSLDDEFAKKLGLESMEMLNEIIKQKILADFGNLAHLRTKRLIFDALEEIYQFDVPESMFKLDFDMMWAEVKKQLDQDPKAFDKPIEELEEEYRKIAKRRVRLGILLAELARENNITVDESDIEKAIIDEAKRHPGQEKLVVDFYSNKDNTERLKGPILEDKAVQHILTKIKTVEKTVTSQDFFEVYAKDLAAPANLAQEA